MSAPTPSPLEARLERVERAIVAISAEVASIRAELAGTSSPSAATSQPTGERGQASRAGSAPRRDRRIARPTASDLERLLGRYGMLLIAVAAAVAAVGTFLSWAVTRGYLDLGPAVRVVIGLGAAVGLGVWGFRLRRRERSFGSSIVALALIVVMVCAYAAGPGFHLVPSIAAFAGAALISGTLAIFAHAEDDETLWCAGFGGAALAPFVTSDRTGSVYALLAYGLLVLLPACFAMSHRAWPIAWRVFYVVSAAFTLAGAELGHRHGLAGFIVALAFPFVIAAAGVVPFAPDDRKRAALRWLGILAAVCASAVPVGLTTDAWFAAGAALAALALWLFLVDRQALVAQSSLLEGTRDNVALLEWIDGAVIPLVLAYQSTVALRAIGDAVDAYVVATIAFVAFVWRRPVSPLCDASAFAALLMGAGVAAGLPIEEPLGRTIAFVALSLVVLAAHRARPSVSWLGGGLFMLVACAAAATGLLLDRKPYVYAPFRTEPSLVALVVLAGLVAVSRSWYSLRVATRAAMGGRPEWTYATNARVLLRAVSVAPWVWAFLWGVLELSMAYSASTSTLLLVTYFAATAVGCVGVGRARHSARLRQVGLGLALVAAATAFYGATTYFDIGARILAYLVTSAFLLGIAYWYRRPGGLETAPDATA